ncbi:unnamed protein product [Orchesella dallaii]|uniref:Gustatory receptor n=1 Tax=Orchesella dallaii TaxID=48710 RepID=A0ABP1QWQ1_9HEXA
MYPMPMKWDRERKQLVVFPWWKFKIWVFVITVKILLIGCGSLIFVSVRQRFNPHPEVTIAHIAFFWGCLCIALADVGTSYLAIFKWPEVLPQTMQNVLSFHAELQRNFPNPFKQVNNARARSAIYGSKTLSFFVKITSTIPILLACIFILINFDPYYFISHYFIGDPIYYDRKIIVLTLMCRLIMAALDAAEGIRVIMMVWTIYYAMIWIIITDLKVLIQSLIANYLRSLSLRRLELIMLLVNQLRLIIICNFSVFTAQLCAILISTGFSSCVVAIWLAIKGVTRFPFYILLIFFGFFSAMQLFFAILFNTVVSIHGNSEVLILLLRRLTRNLSKNKKFDVKKILALHKQSQAIRPILMKCGKFFGFHRGIHLIYMDLLVQFVANSLILVE